MRRTFGMWVVLAGMASTSALAQDDIQKKVELFLQGKVRQWVSDPEIVNAIKQQNDKHAKLTSDDITRLDNDWKTQAKAGQGPLVSGVIDNEVSDRLRAIKDDSGNVVTEVFVMDDKGLNVGAAEATSDYWQGDEAKWQKSFQVGPDAIYIDNPKFDESSGMTQVQASMTIVDPATKQAIGAITVGLNVKGLQ